VTRRVGSLVRQPHLRVGLKLRVLGVLALRRAAALRLGLCEQDRIEDDCRCQGR
jgi:hypothetical protein